MSRVRRASHAGSWYDNDATSLSEELDSYLEAARATTAAAGAKKTSAVAASAAASPACAIISPHAGYRFSGPTAAFAYASIAPDTITRVFVLGPLHHVHLSCCGLPSLSAYATPFGNLEIDSQVVADLASSGMFNAISRHVDEDEHSIEMQLPFLALLFSRLSGGGLKRVKLVPIFVGGITDSQQQQYGDLLSTYLGVPGNLFVFSSDFCHWGKRFSFTSYDSSRGERIHEWIRRLDHEAMALIETHQTQAFADYKRRTKNTICGARPISIFLHMISRSGEEDFESAFLSYAQSSQCHDLGDSSVSYAAAATTCVGLH